MRLDISYKNKTVKNTNTWRLNNTFLNNRRNEKEIKKFLETNDNQNMTAQKPMGCSKNSSKYQCTQHRSTSIPKTDTNRHKRRN